MKSAGNDIVALQIIDKQRTCHSAFYSKFITVAEQALYQQTDVPFESFVWLLWSVKEAVYKYLKRNYAGLIFSPSKITIQNIEVPANSSLSPFNGDRWESDKQINGLFYTGMVLYSSHILYYRSKLHNEFIATVVNDEQSFDNVYWGVQLISKTDNESQAGAVRMFLLDKLSRIIGADDLRIVKENDCPVLVNNGKKPDIPVSLAHHGQFVTYSFCLNHRLS